MEHIGNMWGAAKGSKEIRQAEKNEAQDMRDWTYEQGNAVKDFIEKKVNQGKDWLYHRGNGCHGSVRWIISQL